jgi:predicted Zn-dependent protease
MIDPEILNSFAKDPNSFESNYKLGKEYENRYQYSSAIGFLLRAADRSNTNDELYNSLISVAYNMIQQKDNLHTAENILKRVCYFYKERPEGWFFLGQINKLLNGSKEDRDNYLKMLILYTANEKGIYFIDYTQAA